MRKFFFVLIGLVVLGFVLTPSVWSREKTIRIGINAPLTGDIPKVGEGTKFAALMWLEDIQKDL